MSGQKDSMENQQNQSNDNYFKKIKYIAYCLCNGSIEENNLTFEDLINYAVFQLSLEKRILLKDPIWRLYSDEDILIEYYAILFSKSEEIRIKFIRELHGIKDDVDFLE